MGSGGLPGPWWQAVLNLLRNLRHTCPPCQEREGSTEHEGVRYAFLPAPDCGCISAKTTYLPAGSGPLATGFGALAGSYWLAASYLSSRSSRANWHWCTTSKAFPNPRFDESSAPSRRFCCTGPATPSSKARTASSLSLANPGRRAKHSRPTPCHPHRTTTKKTGRHNAGTASAAPGPGKAEG